MATRAVRGAEHLSVSRTLIRIASKHSLLLDLALAGSLAVIVIFNAATGTAGQPAAGTAVLVIGALALGHRRRWPVALAAVTIAAYLADHLLTRHTGPGQPAVLISLYTVAAHKERKVALGATLAAAAAVMVGQSAHTAPRASGVAVSILAVLASAMIGLLIAERHREQERDRRLLAENAAAEERVRIARELHDVVAHHLSVIVVQANVLAEAAPADDASDISARAIVDSGRSALAEMRRILDVLRSGDEYDSRGRGPQPGLAQLGDLVSAVRDAGLKVEVQIEGSERSLPAAVDLSAYRIVQEALTNVLRHADATTAKVRLTYAPAALELQIADDGLGAPSAGNDSRGHGLAGMRERARMLGGEFSAGPANGNGYAVRVVLPL